ncbi:hypothetical protein ABFS82_12G077100 [Erythranthe guttata]
MVMRKLVSIFRKSNDRFPCINYAAAVCFTKIPSSARRIHMYTRAAAVLRRKKKIVVIMGATGCGKTKLAVDLASRFFPSSEIINSDKIQVYRGLDITTNKIPFSDRRNVRHHLLGDFDPSESHPEFTPSDFRASASTAVAQILSRRRTPFVVGGSNSFVYALLAERFNPDADVFAAESSESAFCRELRYSCCFIWIDVSLPVLNRHLAKRVDHMLDSGMADELAEYFKNQESDSVSQRGLKRAIGVPEFERYFKWGMGDVEEAVGAIKENTCQLAERQVGKILRLRDAAGWELKRVEATAAIRAAAEGGGGAADIWERKVVEPSVKIVKEFLME